MHILNYLQYYIIRAGELTNVDRRRHRWVHKLFPEDMFDTCVFSEYVMYCDTLRGN
ncbi:hypothetical protein C0J52_07382 [Blattella germanica]|nr:hypothetical protein C0J52_07382 [Blattella germanica]